MEKQRVGEIHYESLVERMQQSMVQRGLMRPIRVQHFAEEINNLIAGYKEVAKDDLTRNWDNYFPDVQYTEERMEQTLNDALQAEREKHIGLFVEELEKRKYFRSYLGRVFLKGQLPFLAGAVISFVTIPVCFALLLTPSDMAFFVGAWGLVFDLITLPFLFYKYRRAVRRLKKSQS